MGIHTTNYYSTFILVADDCALQEAQVPPVKLENPTVAQLQYDMIIKSPYIYTSDDIVFEVYAQKNNITKPQQKAARELFFSKGQPCLRCSPLTKKYGWGIHSNAEGKVAMYAVNSKMYNDLCNDAAIAKVKAMRSSKK